MKTKYPSTGIAELCKLFGKTRDAWYKAQEFEGKRKLANSIILELVHVLRRDQPKMGVHKLHHELSELLKTHDMVIGLNRLNRLLRDHKLLVQPAKRKPKTTHSNHKYKKWPNLVKDITPNRPEQVVVADITYWRTERGFIYIALLTDAYSHMILGYSINQNLFVTGALHALEMMIDARVYPDKDLIHHSDRGSQYCAKLYVNRLLSKGIGISMTEGKHAGENTIAERINGILKQDFGLPDRFRDYRSAVDSIAQAIKTYNYEYPHGSINYLKPFQAHRISGPIRRRWKYKKKK